MSDFNPAEAASKVSDASKKMAEISEKWSKSPQTKNSFKAYIADHKEFFGKTSTILGVVSFGFAVADATKCFGPSAQEKVMNKLNDIESKIVDLQQTMLQQFNILNAHISYAITSNSVILNLNEINNAKQFRSEFLLSCEIKDTPAYDRAFDNMLKINIVDLSKNIENLYNYFIKTESDSNILMSIYDYYSGSVQLLQVKGMEIILAVQDAIKIIGLVERLESEKKAKKKNTEISLNETLGVIDDQLERLYKDKVNTMYDKLQAMIQKSYDNMEANLNNFYRNRLVPKLKEKKDVSNPTMICETMSDYFPLINFMAMEYDNCYGDELHVDSLIANRSITDYHQKEVNKNILIWWQYEPEPGSYHVDSFSNKSIAIKNNFMIKYSTMRLEYSKTVNGAGGYASENHFRNIHDIIRYEKLSSLDSASPGCNALLVKKTGSGHVNWAHSRNAAKVSIANANFGNNYHVFWFIVDVPN